MIQDRENDFIKCDDEKKKRIKDAGTKDDNKDASAVVVFEHTWGDVEINGLGNLHTDRMVKILSEEGIAKYSVLRFDYDPKTYITNILRLRIFRKDGRIEELDVKNFRDVFQPERLLFWRVRMKLFNIPDLEVGDAIEWEIFKKGFNIAYLGKGSEESEKKKEDWVDPETGISPPMYGAFFDIIYFQETEPVKEKRYTLLSLRELPLVYEFYRGECRTSVLMDDKYITYSWEKKDIDAYKPESRMWGTNGSLPKLLVSSIPDWKAKSIWFHKANINQFEWDDDIKAKVDEITAPWKTDEEKAAALLHWVAQEIRYIGFSISKGEGYTLHPGIMTFRERGGVCKDLAGMLVTMMRAAGYESHPAQTQALVPVNRIPADQFDHCVTAWKKPDGKWEMLDPTWAPYSMNTWDRAETLQNYLIGTEQGEDNLGQTRLFGPEESLMEINARTRLLENGAIEGNIHYQGIGRSDTVIRFQRLYKPAVQENTIYQNYLASIDPRIEVLKFRRGDVENLYEKYFNSAEFKVENYARRENGGVLYFNIPMARFLTNPLVSRYLEEAEKDERKFDMMIIFLQEIVANETLELPEGFRICGKMPVSYNIDKEAAGFSYEIKEEEEGRIQFNARFVLRVRSVTVKQFKDFKEVMNSVKKLSKRIFTIEKRGSRIL